jgi:hypothetical protein
LNTLAEIVATFGAFGSHIGYFFPALETHENAYPVVSEVVQSHKLEVDGDLLPQVLHLKKGDVSGRKHRFEENRGYSTQT